MTQILTRERLSAVEATHEALTDETPGTSAEDGSATALAVEHLADAPERSLQEAADAAKAKGEPIKLRIALQLWNAAAGQYGQYRAWRAQSWVVALPGVEQVRKAQQIIELVFDLIRISGVDQTHDVLVQLKANASAQ